MRRRLYKWTEGANPKLVPASTRVDVTTAGRRVVVGMDLSLTSAAAAKVTLPWDGDPAKVVTRVIGDRVKRDAGPLAHLERLWLISSQLSDFCTGAHAVYLEEYAFSQGQSRAHALGELGGAVKLRIYADHLLVARPIVNSTARKTLLQRLPSPRGKPKGYVKRFVLHNVRRLGGPTEGWNDDEADAFVVMNHGVGLEGGTPLSFQGIAPDL